MSDLAKFSVTGLDGVPRIDPIFTVPPLVEEPRITNRILFDRSAPPDATKERAGKPQPYDSIIADKTKRNANPLIKPEDNLLNSYASYTYNISLHMLSLQTYNRIMGANAINTNEAFNYTPENVLVVSGGRLGLNTKISDIETGTILNTPQRHPFWQENFFFEDLKLRTVISPTQMSRGTNVIEGQMQILEPNGFTFINRLIQTVLNVNPNTNYMFNPYMIQIDFFGMHANTEGSTASEKNPVRLDALKKLFPICMTSIKTKVTNKGTMYTIDFVPYAHKAFNRTNNVSPANFNIPASTVEEFFNNNQTDSIASSISSTRQRELTLKKLKNDRAELGQLNFGLTAESLARLDSQIEEYEKLVRNGINATGFCAAFNLFQKELLKDKQNDLADEIEIRFHETIGKSKLVKDASVTQAAADQFLQAKNIILAQGGKGNQTINFNGIFITVPAGTIIDKLIEFIVRNSEYFLNQIKIENDDRKIPLQWYKIVPRVEIVGYSNFRKTFATRTVYWVFPYTIYGASHPYVSNGIPDAQVKKYDYIFTGKNTEVLELSIDFNLLYNLSIPVNRQQENVAHGLSDQNIELAEELATPQVKTKNYIEDPTQPYPIYLHSGQTRYQGTSGGFDTLNKQELAASVLHSINLDSRGDMINVKLKILGDPDFIKQDDIFYNSFFFQKKDIRINGNGGSLWMDTGNLTIQLNINSPVDYDDTFGLAVPNRDPYGGIFTYNAFSGIYKIITIENHFYKGKFEQTLDIVRSPIQNVNQLRSADQKLQENREQLNKALSLAKNVNSNRPTNLLNIPIRSTAGALGRTASLLYGQQVAVNQAATAVASLNSIVGGLQNVAALPAILTQVAVATVTRTVTGIVGKGIDTAAKSLIDAFNPAEVVNPAFNALNFEAGFGLEGVDTFLDTGAADLVAAFGF